MPRPIPSLEESKRAASLLIKDLNSADTSVAEKAGARFLRVPPFKEKTAADIVRERDAIQLKHALAVIVREQGYVAWKNLKDAADVLWCPPGTSAFWQNWCKTHAEAHEYREARGGYILTGHGKCFVAERGYIEVLGLDPDDPRWEKIGFDVAKPRDTRACEELVAQRTRVAAGST